MPSDVAIEARGLTRSFGKRPAIIDLDITVNTGDIYGFLGPNGAGKTTAIRCLTGLIPPDRGTMKVFGNSDLVAAREHIGAIVETPNFHGWMSGRGNLEQAAPTRECPDPVLRSTGCWSGSASRSAPRTGPEPTPSACASASASPGPC